MAGEKNFENRLKKSLKIEVELSNQTLTLEKTRQRPIGFQPPPKRERMVIEYAFVY